VSPFGEDSCRFTSTNTVITNQSNKQANFNGVSLLDCYCIIVVVGLITPFLFKFHWRFFMNFFFFLFSARARFIQSEDDLFIFIQCRVSYQNDYPFNTEKYPD